ncbi:unnamed protein product, partial [Pleuronectes platessa]
DLINPGMVTWVRGSNVEGPQTPNDPKNITDDASQHILEIYRAPLHFIDSKIPFGRPKGQGNYLRAYGAPSHHPLHISFSTHLPCALPDWMAGWQVTELTDEACSWIRARCGRTMDYNLWIVHQRSQWWIQYGGFYIMLAHRSGNDGSFVALELKYLIKFHVPQRMNPTDSSLVAAGTPCYRTDLTAERLMMADVVLAGWDPARHCRSLQNR